MKNRRQAYQQRQKRVAARQAKAAAVQHYSSARFRGILAMSPPRQNELHRLLKLSEVVSYPLAPAIGGFVFVMDHYYGFERYWFFSVNHLSHNGTGWQSERIYRREDAELVASVLADFCGAELVE